MNLEAVRQLQATTACQHGTDSWQHLTLPFGNIFERFVCFFCEVSLFQRHSDNLAGVRIEVGNAVIALQFQCLDDLSESNDSCRGVPRFCSRRNRPKDKPHPVQRGKPNGSSTAVSQFIDALCARRNHPSSFFGSPNAVCGQRLAMRRSSGHLEIISDRSGTKPLRVASINEPCLLVLLWADVPLKGDSRPYILVVTRRVAGMRCPHYRNVLVAGELSFLQPKGM